MTKERSGYKTIPFPKVRQPIVDALRWSRTMSVMHALVEIDVTDARAAVREYRKRSGEPLSFTAFLAYGLARAVGENPIVQAYRKRGRLIVFDDVDLSVQIERDIDDQGPAPVYPHVIKAANRKSLKEIHGEIGTAKADDTARMARMTARYWYLPRFVRSLLWRRWLGSPYWRKRLTGTVVLSAVGMFGQGSGWGIPVSTYTLSVVAGGIAAKPGLAGGQVALRQYLSVTVSFDHNVIDGAPAARFIQRFKELVEGGAGLEEVRSCGN
jgi:pyruvate/2-oxoglutarate dehydrogenase complex dihydrolipoamide acyltransferase (E2) component